ncbi:MAG: hypothetical protein COT43_09850 [Candidatus Marinimicrobia bacterium CG08_land_8_20_14_0_20_45_22]|nr:MAG: hypothetical protein COT43_09850 [Candidatus Marinimicrobia bacterium CG08_land_8_20_14_0_20_45_22]
MGQAILALIIIYLVWKLIKPVIYRLEEKREASSSKKSNVSRSFGMNPKDIQDAEFKDIDTKDKTDNSN